MRELEDQTPPTVMPSRVGNVRVFDPYPHASPGNRDITLRMTLTRKDLCADENELPVRTRTTESGNFVY